MSLTTSRFFLFYWWFQKFGLGVLVGFLLGLMAGWLLASRRAGGAKETAAAERSDHLSEADRQLEALRKELSGPGAG